MLCNANYKFLQSLDELVSPKNPLTKERFENMSATFATLVLFHRYQKTKQRHCNILTKPILNPLTKLYQQEKQNTPL